MNSLPKSVSISPRVLFQELDGEAALLDTATDRYYSLNAIGTRMWLLLAANGDTDAMIDQVLAKYDVDEMTVRHDAAEWLTRLERAGLVTMHGV